MTDSSSPLALVRGISCHLSPPSPPPPHLLDFLDILTGWIPAEACVLRRRPSLHPEEHVLLFGRAHHAREPPPRRWRKRESGLFVAARMTWWIRRRRRRRPWFLPSSPWVVMDRPFFHLHFFNRLEEFQHPHRRRHGPAGPRHAVAA